MSKRPDSLWVIVMLAETVADVPTADIAKDLSKHLQNSSVIFPARTSTGRVAWGHAYGAYAFMCVDPEAPVARVERSRYVERVVRTPDGQQFEMLTAEKMRPVFRSARPRVLRKGAKVRILLGDWAGMTGKVAVVDRPRNRACVQIRLHSGHIKVHTSLHELERV